MNEMTFWMVWNPVANVPRIKHETRSKAEAEAARLAKLHPGQSFYVLRAVEKVFASNVIFQKLTNYDDGL